jgi:hypothetical protein
MVGFRCLSSDGRIEVLLISRMRDCRRRSSYCSQSKGKLLQEIEVKNGGILQGPYILPTIAVE